MSTYIFLYIKDSRKVVETLFDHSIIQKEIEEFNEYYKTSACLSMNSHSLYSIYQSYCKYAFEKGYNVISKRWFEKYFISKYDMFLIDNTIVSSKWFQL